MKSCKRGANISEVSKILELSKCRRLVTDGDVGEQNSRGLQRSSTVGGYGINKPNTGE